MAENIIPYMLLFVFQEVGTIKVVCSRGFDSTEGTVNSRQ